MAADGEVNFVKWLMLSRRTLKRQGGVVFFCFFFMFGSIGVYHGDLSPPPCVWSVIEVCMMQVLMLLWLGNWFYIRLPC